MSKTAIAECIMVAAIMTTVLLMVSSVGLILLTHMGTMVFW